MKKRKTLFYIIQWPLISPLSIFLFLSISTNKRANTLSQVINLNMILQCSIFLFIFWVLNVGHTQQCLGFIPSFVLTNYSWLRENICGSWDQICIGYFKARTLSNVLCLRHLLKFLKQKTINSLQLLFYSFMFLNILYSYMKKIKIDFK